QILNRLNFNSPVPTTVVVFQTADDYKPFKPVKSNGETNDLVSGFFQAARDVNYITLSTEAKTERTYQIIFHEFTHFLVRNNLGESNIPPWYNEGLAIYYETLAFDGDQNLTLGGSHQNLLQVLQRNELIP